MAQAKIFTVELKHGPGKTQFSTFVFNEITGFKISKNLDRGYFWNEPGTQFH